jgi:hypothetical protein
VLRERREFRTEGGESLENLMVFLHDGKVIGLTSVTVMGKAPTVGGDNDRRLAGEPVQVWIGRDERCEYGPLRVGEVSGEIWVTGWQWGIMCTFF